MPSVGFEGALGQQAMAEQIRQRLMDELNKTKTLHGLSVEDQRLALEKQRVDQEAQDRALLRSQQGTAFNETLAEKTAANLTPQSIISPELATRFKNTSLAPLISADQALPSASIAGGASLPGADEPAAVAPTVTQNAPTLTGQLRYAGTPTQVKTSADDAAISQLARDPKTSPAIRGFLQMRQALPKGENIPYQLLEPPKPSPITDANYSLNGKPIVGLKDASGRIHYQGQDVTDRVQPYVAPKQGDTVDQSKLEQQYRTVLARGMSSRSGGIGLEDAKVQQANHLTAVLDQFYDPKTGEWNIPRVQLNELALGLARLTSPGGQAGEGMLHEFQQRTAAGDLAGALTYITGQPVAANTQAITAMLKDSIERQGKTAEQNREGEMRYLRGLAPTELEESRRQALEANTLNPLRQSRVIANPKTGERKLQVSIDGGKTWQ